MGDRRRVFLNATSLSKQYKSIPAEVLNDALFFFGEKRSWLFPTNREEMLEARSLRTKYLEFDEDFKTLVLHKEEQRMVFWWLPEKSYEKASAFIESIVDPVTGENYRPLLLNENWWLTEFAATDGKYTSDAGAIVKNFQQGVFDTDAVMELLHQSNQTLFPTLHWTEN